jgi:N-acetylglucosaminyldiphosphoundecaprenol N-acetyl-beta-D-mannosaminyltransferase
MRDAINISPALKEIVPNFDRNVHCVLGLTLDAVTFDEAKKLVVKAIEERRSLFLTTPNTNFLTISRSDPKFRDSVLRSDLCVADGMPLVLVSRILGTPIRHRVSGSSLFASLMTDATIRMNVFFLGGAEGIAKAAAERLNQLENNVRGVGHHFPGFSSVDPGVLDRINLSNADFLMVALGARKGQTWITENERYLSAPVISYLGSTINFVANAVKRAPSMWQRLGLEWMWRIKEEPHLWRRYFLDLTVLVQLCASRVIPWLLYRLIISQNRAASLRLEKSGGVYALSFSGAWDQRNLAPVRIALQEAAEAKADIVLDFGDLAYADSAFLGLMLLAYGHQARTGRRLSINSLGKKMKSLLYFHGCEFLAESKPRPENGCAIRHDRLSHRP